MDALRYKSRFKFLRLGQAIHPSVVNELVPRHAWEEQNTDLFRCPPPSDCVVTAFKLPPRYAIRSRIRGVYHKRSDRRLCLSFYHIISWIWARTNANEGGAGCGLHFYSSFLVWISCQGQPSRPSLWGR